MISAMESYLIFSVDKTALQIIAYYDLIEVVNPLGSRTHKLGSFNMNAYI